MTNSKRIPLQSAVPGFSRKAWAKFINRLTDREIDMIIHNNFVCSECSLSGCDPHTSCQECESILSRLFGALCDSGYKFPPMPRLVGIETNPGPNPPSLNKKKVSTTIVVREPKPSQRVAVRASGRAQVHSSSQSLIRSYTNTLTDPFEHPPIVLGYDTFVPTGLATGYVRGSMTVNADGSFGLCMRPTLISQIIQNTAGAAVATWGSVSATNFGAIQSQTDEARVVSMGVRIMALFPLTSAPGVLFCANDPGTLSQTGLQLLTPTSISGLPNAEIGVGTKGCQAYGRPIDAMSYTFRPEITSGYSVGDLPLFSNILVSGLGFPTGTKIWYESILNVEILPRTSSSSIGINTNASPQGTLADLFPSPQSLFNSIRSYLGDSVTMNAALGAAEAYGQFTGNRAVSGASRLARTALGSGTHYRAAMLGGRNEAFRGRQNRMVIEEVKDEYERV